MFSSGGKKTALKGARKKPVWLAENFYWRIHSGTFTGNLRYKYKVSITGNCSNLQGISLNQ